ncbi:uncharacterized protein LOC141907773 [Tubulanus polymorphus]|uniref:uncharacterized protein LOC141907773 n=1 Tax=Tubulanus polymorphus TaxID=672921 RepID=UPI003DA49AE6
MAEQERRNFIEKVPDASVNDACHYLPHHSVLRDSNTTPLRIVYDFSCKTPEKTSLNDCLLTGPRLHNNILGILLRFRSFNFAAIADIEKAFLQIELDEHDRDYTRFLWLSDPSDPDSDLITYRFRAVLFGATCSPMILNATVLKHLRASDSDLSRLIAENIYVDNCGVSFDSEFDMLQFYSQSRGIMALGGFNLRCWSSNSHLLMNAASSDGVAESDNCVKFLGVQWFPFDNDQLNLKLLDINVTSDQVVTKRVILSDSSKVFDPLGWIAPVVLNVKLLLQILWKLADLDWDTSIPDTLREEWSRIASDISNATLIPYPRKYFDKTSSLNGCEIHIFANASATSYGACAYIVSPARECSLLISKSRVAPVRPLTIPQLELMAALIAARLAKLLKESFPTCKYYLWSDNQSVLYRLSNAKNLKPFEQKRIDEIKLLTESDSWGYCPPDSNPSDISSRGSNYTDLVINNLWWKGPDWLVTDETSSESSSYRKIDPLIDITRISSLRKLLRVTAYVLRFIGICQKRRSRGDILEPSEIEESKLVWVIYVQHAAYIDVFDYFESGKAKRPLIVSQLGLYIDESGVIRCGGRLDFSQLPPSSRNPLWLPKHSRFTDLVVLAAHAEVKHLKVNPTMASIREEYWILQIRQCVKRVIRPCVLCRKLEGASYGSRTPPPLPYPRVSNVPAFQYTGVDFCGHFNVILSSNESEMVKCYIALFTCAVSRATHLEVVRDLGTGSFILAFRRFAARKSLPYKMISDNASTFYAARDELKAIFDSLREYLAIQGVQWKFIVKRRARVAVDEFRTIVTEAEATINDRPLTYQSSDISDLEPLTPSHLVCGRKITALPYRVNDASDPEYGINQDIAVERPKLCASVIKEFREQWAREYLVSLRERSLPGQKPFAHAQKGDVVIINAKSENVL